MHNLFLRISKIWENWVVSQKKIIQKKYYALILILYGGNVVWCLLVSLTITCLRCLCLKGFVKVIVKTKVYRYKELRLELVYRIKLLQRVGLGAGTKWVKGQNVLHWIKRQVQVGKTVKDLDLDSASDARAGRISLRSHRQLVYHMNYGMRWGLKLLFLVHVRLAEFVHSRLTRLLFIQ
jgi:hypothetical protein